MATGICDEKKKSTVSFKKNPIFNSFFPQQSYHTIITTKYEFDIMLYAGNTVYWEWSNTESYVLHYVYVLYLLNTK